VYDNQQNASSQAKSSVSRQANQHRYLYDPNPVRKFKVNPYQYLDKRYTDKQLEVYNEILKRKRRHGFVEYTHAGLAKDLGLDDQTVLSTETKMIEDGTLVIQRRNHKRLPTLARVSSYFNSKSVRKALAWLLPELLPAVLSTVCLLQPVDRYGSGFYSNNLFERTGDYIYSSNDIYLADEKKPDIVSHSRAGPAAPMRLGRDCLSDLSTNPYTLDELDIILGVPELPARGNPPTLLTGAEEYFYNHQQERREGFVTSSMNDPQLLDDSNSPKGNRSGSGGGSATYPSSDETSSLRPCHEKFNDIIKAIWRS